MPNEQSNQQRRAAGAHRQAGGGDLPAESAGTRRRHSAGPCGGCVLHLLCHGPQPHQRLPRHVERHFYEHHPFFLGHAGLVQPAVHRHCAGARLQDAVLEHWRRGPGAHRRPCYRADHGLLRQQPARTGPLCGHGAGQSAGGGTVGVCSRLVQIPLEHQRNPLHADDELCGHQYCGLHDQPHARSGVQPGHPQQGHQGGLAAGDRGPALHHQHHCGHCADLCHVRLSALLQTGL